MNALVTMVKLVWRRHHVGRIKYSHSPKEANQGMYQHGQPDTAEDGRDLAHGPILFLCC